MERQLNRGLVVVAEQKRSEASICFSKGDLSFLGVSVDSMMLIDYFEKMAKRMVKEHGCIVDLIRKDACWLRYENDDKAH